MVTLIYENNLIKKSELYSTIQFFSHLFSWSFISAGLSFLRLLAFICSPISVNLTKLKARINYILRAKNINNLNLGEEKAIHIKYFVFNIIFIKSVEFFFKSAEIILGINLNIFNSYLSCKKPLG